MHLQRRPTKPRQPPPRSRRRGHHRGRRWRCRARSGSWLEPL